MENSRKYSVLYFVYDNRDKCITRNGFEKLEKAVNSAIKRGGATVKAHNYYQDPERDNKLYPDGDPVVVWRDTLTVTKHPIQVCFVNLGEGYSGDFDPSDPDDERLLRLDLKKWDSETETYEDSESVCTCMASTTEEEVKQKALEALADLFYEDHIAPDGHNTRLLIGKASYISDDNIQEFIDQSAQLRVRRVAYERFQLDWLATHGFSMRDVFKSAKEWGQALLDDMLTPEDYSFEAHIDEQGFGHGFSYPCYREFLGAEFCDEGLMKLLLDEEQFAVWEKDPFILPRQELATTDINTNNRVLRVVEENVDGCGSDAVMYVEFSRMLNTEIQERFQNHLRAAKGRADACDQDTEEMVTEAVDNFNKSIFAKALDVQAEICDAPYFGVATF